MLYQVFESHPLVYAGLTDEGICFPELVAPPREYRDAMTAPWGGGFWNGWVERKTVAGTQSVSTIYALCRIDTATWWFPIFIVGKWDGLTGKFIDSDRTTVGSFFNWIFSASINFIQDDVGQLWHWEYSMFSYSGVVRRHPPLTEQISDGFMGQIGMPDLRRFYWDLSIWDGEWLNEAGTATDADVFANFHPLAISQRGDWLVADHTGVGPTGGDLPEFPKPYVAVYTISTRRRRGFIRLRSQAVRGISAPGDLAYLFTVDGAIELINCSTLENLGTLNYNLTSHDNIGSWDDLSFAAAYDQAYRRLLVIERTADDPITGACTSRWRGYAPREVSLNVTKPLPLKVPKEGRTVPVLIKAYGSGGTGIGGEGVTISVNEAGGTIYPTQTSTDPTGDIVAYWACGSEGPDAATIEVSIDTQRTIPGLTPGGYTKPIGVLPTYVEANEQERYFLPGWWLASTTSTRVRTQTAAQALEPYLSQFDTEENTYTPNFRGALIEYSWYDLETGVGTYDLSQIIADLAYLKSRGLKMIIAIRTSQPKPNALVLDPTWQECSPWIPAHMYEDDTDLFQASSLGIGYTGCTYTVYPPVPSNSSVIHQTIYPMLFSETIKYALIGLVQAILAQFQSDNDVVGIVPFDYPKILSGAVERCLPYPDFPVGTVGPDAIYEAMRDIYTALLGSTNKLLFGYCSETNNDYEGSYSVVNMASSSMRTWMVDNGVGLLGSFWLTQYNSGAIGSMSAAFSSANSVVPTGIAIPGWCWTDGRNLTTAGDQATAQDVLMGSASMVKSGNYYWAVDVTKPWMCFIEPDASVWSGDSGIMEITSTKSLYKYKEFYG